MSFSPPKKIDNFLRKSKLNFWTKNEDFEQCVCKRMKISNFCFVVQFCSCTRTKRRKRAKMTTWYMQTWTNQHLEQVKLNPFLRFSRFQLFCSFHFRNETREWSRINGICWNQTSVRMNLLQLKNNYSTLPNYAFNVFQEYDLFDRMTILILKL